MRVVILDPSLHYLFDEFDIVSRVLHEEMPHCILKTIRLSSLHDKNYFSSGGPNRGHPGVQYGDKSQKTTPYLKCGEKCKNEMNARGKLWKMSGMDVVTCFQAARVVSRTYVARSQL